MGDVLNAFVKAPQDIRWPGSPSGKTCPRMLPPIGLGVDDELRARFTRLFYSANWADESLFDLVVDTGVDSDEAALAGKIVAAVNALQVPGEVDRPRPTSTSIRSSTAPSTACSDAAQPSWANRPRR